MSRGHPKSSEPCIYYEQDMCCYTDEECRYTHVRDPEEEKLEMREFLSSVPVPPPPSISSRPRKRYPKSSEICRYYETGLCIYSDEECRYTHVKEPEEKRLETREFLSSAPASPPPSVLSTNPSGPRKRYPKSSEICRYYETGLCFYSDEDCRYTHIRDPKADEADAQQLLLSMSYPYPSGTDSRPKKRAALGFTEAANSSSVPATISDVGTGSFIPYTQPTSADAESLNFASRPIKRPGLGFSEGAAWSSCNSTNSDQGGGGFASYIEPTFPEAETLNFARTELWDEKTLDQSGIRRISFGPDFAVEDCHLAAIGSRKELASSLQSLSLGDSDSGHGSRITDGGVKNLVEACPNLRVLVMDSTRLGDVAFSACIYLCPSLELLSITGSEKTEGNVTSMSVIQLAFSPTELPKLRKLVIVDQSHSIPINSIEKLSENRRELIIVTGHTVGNGGGDAAIMKAFKSGRFGWETWYGGKRLLSPA